MRILIQTAYALRRTILGMLKLRTRGVKVMLFNEAGHLLLIRNSYGNRNLFVLPGGGVGRRETPEVAAAREVKEELGIAPLGLTSIGTYQSGAEGKRDTVHLFRARIDGDATPDSVELEEARCFPLNALPDNVSPATMRRIEELKGERPVDGRW